MLNTNELTNKNPDELIDIISSLQNKLTQHQRQLPLQNKDALITCFNETISLLKHEKFKSRSEKFIDNSLQGRLFDEVTLPENAADIEEAEQEIQVPAHKRKKRGRKALPKDLPHEQIIHDLSQEDKQCGCGCLLSHIGDECTEQLDIVPATIKVIEHVQLKYACKACKETIKLANKTKQPIPKSFATAGLLAYVLTQKFQFHLPLYRQEQMFKAIGVDLLRGTLSNWVIKCSIQLFID